MKFNMDNIVRVIREQDPQTDIDESTYISHLHTTQHGWLYYGKSIKDMATLAKIHPDFFADVDAIKIDEKIYQL